MSRTGTIKFSGNISGTSAVEFALVSPFFLMFLFAIFDFGQGLKLYNELEYASSRASRMIMLNEDVPNSDIETQIRASLNGLKAEDLQVAFTTTMVDGRNYRVINISYPFRFVTPFITSLDVNLSAASRTPQSS